MVRNFALGGEIVSASGFLRYRLSEPCPIAEEKRAEVFGFRPKSEGLTFRIETLHARIETLQAKMESLHAKMETLHAKMETLHARIETLPARIDGLVLRMEPLTVRIERSRVGCSVLIGRIVPAR